MPKPAVSGGWFDFHDGRACEGGRVHTVSAPLGRLPLFVRAGALIPVNEGGDAPEFLIFGQPEKASATLYLDDGSTADWEGAGGSVIEVSAAPPRFQSIWPDAPMTSLLAPVSLQTRAAKSRACARHAGPSSYQENHHD